MYLARMCCADATLTIGRIASGEVKEKKNITGISKARGGMYRKDSAGEGGTLGSNMSKKVVSQIYRHEKTPRLTMMGVKRRNLGNWLRGI